MNIKKIVIFILGIILGSIQSINAPQPDFMLFLLGVMWILSFIIGVVLGLFYNSEKIAKKDLNYFPRGLFIGGFFTFLFYSSNTNSENPIDTLNFFGGLIGLPVVVYIPETIFYIFGTRLIIKIKEEFKNK